MFTSTTLLISLCIAFGSPCYNAQPVESDLNGTLSFTAMNDSQVLVGMLDGTTNRMVVWEDGEVVTEVTSFYESYGVLINNEGVAAGLGNNGIFQDDRLIRANTSGTFEILATITGSGGWSSLTAMNEQGSIVGNYSGGSGSSDWQPFVWTDETGLEFLGSNKTTAYVRDIDHNNVVTGYGEVGGTYHAMLWDGGVAIDLAMQLGLKGNSSGWYFDDQGRVLISEYLDSETRFQWYDPSDSSLVEIHTFPFGSYTLRVVASGNGRLAFSWSTFESEVYLARWTHEAGFEFAELDTDVVGTSAMGINDQGKVACGALILPFYDSIAMIWDDGIAPVSLHDLIPDTPMSTFAITITSQGDVLVRGDASNWILQLGCNGDIDHDGEVSVNDLLIMLSQWGTDGGGSCGSDLDASGVIDVGDVLALIGQWGSCE
jgi:hypothetical protein